MASKSAAMKKDIIKLPFTKTNLDSLCDLTLIKTRYRKNGSADAASYIG